jgi:hypothetical protein
MFNENYILNTLCMYLMAVSKFYIYKIIDNITFNKLIIYLYFSN